MIDDLDGFSLLNRLKQVYRAGSVGSRKESAAEHTWSAMVLADYFFDKIDKKLDCTKVFELLLYHDVVEIEAGDTVFEPGNEAARKTQAARELAAAKKLRTSLPMGERFFALFAEFEEGKTLEARYARAIETFDAIIHEVDYKHEWKGWTKKFVLDHKEKYFLEFPALHEALLKVLDELEARGYFSQP